LNSTKATHELGWKRVFSFREAIGNTVEEYRMMERAHGEGLFRDRIKRIKSFEKRISLKK
jgi:hypothetical protein